MLTVLIYQTFSGARNVVSASCARALVALSVRTMSGQYYRAELMKEERERRIRESSENCLSLVEDSIHIGAAAADELYRQGEVLDRTEQRLDDIDDDLKTTQHHIRGIRSIFASLFSRKPKIESKIEETPPKEEARRLDTSSVRQRAEELKWESSSCDDPIDRTMMGVSRGLDELKSLAVSLGNELDRQNPHIERVTERTMMVKDRVGDQDKQIKKILN